MSDYVQSTNFATKDSLSSGNPLKIVKGTEINTEFANIAIAVATKADLASPTFTGTPAAPTASAGNNSTQISTTAYVDAAITAVKAALFPVGAIYTAVVSTNPGTLLGFGTWTAFGAGRVMVGFDSGNALFDTAEETGGSADAITVSHTHTGTTDSNGSHQHFVVQSETRSGYPGGPTTSSSVASALIGGGPTNEAYALAPGTGSANVGLSSSAGAHTHTFTTGSSGSSGTNANYQPYITVYMWKRTA
ncbi:MAG: phage baseplate protein [Planctomycetota bacterium]